MLPSKTQKNNLPKNRATPLSIKRPPIRHRSEEMNGVAVDLCISLPTFVLSVNVYDLRTLNPIRKILNYFTVGVMENLVRGRELRKDTWKTDDEG